MSGPLGKCAPCLDQAILAAGEAALLNSVPDAVVLVTVIQPFNVPGQQIAAPALMPVCLSCRKAQLGTVSKKGLITA